MLKSIPPEIFQKCVNRGLNTSQTEKLAEEFFREMGRYPLSFGELLEVLE